MRIAAKAAALALLALALAAPAQASFPGPNGKIYFTGQAVAGGVPQGGVDVFSVNPDGSELVNLTDLPGGTGGGFGPSVSGDGSKVAYAAFSGGDSDIWVINADGTNPVRLTNSSALPANAKTDQMPGISADGSRIAFMSTRDTPAMSSGFDYDIWVMDSDGTNQELLLNGPGEDYRPEFSPDGETVVMASEVSGDLDIAYVPSTGGPFSGATTITGMSTELENTLSIRPDQVRIAYSKRLSGQYDLRDSYFDGTDEFPIAIDPALSETHPSFSPDVTKIAFANGSGITIADLGGSNPAPLALDPSRVINAGEPEWAVGEPLPPATDTTAPQTTLTIKPKRKLKTRKTKIGFVSTEPLSTFECRLDKAGFAPCSSPKQLRRLKPRRHRFEVRATDSSGNTDQTPAKAKFKVKKR